MPRLTRYALYYRLMDICFIIQIVSIVLEVVERTANGDAPFGPLSTVVMAFQLSAVLIPIVLIFFRSMRDDFAEELWQKTAGTVLKALTFLPIIAAVVFGLLIGTGTVDIPGDIFAEDGISDAQVVRSWARSCL